MSAPTAPAFRVTKLTLFSHGIANFQLTATVDAPRASLSLAFRDTHMNDVLKSLTVVDTSGAGRITSVTYDSATPLEEQLATIGVSIPGQNTLTGLLSQLQGAPVKLSISTTTSNAETLTVIHGRAMGMQKVREEDPIARSRGGSGVVERDAVVVQLQGGEIRTVALEDVKAVEFTDGQVQRDVTALMDVLLASKMKNKKRMVINAEGEGKRTIQVNYVIEAPVWKTSYRIILRKDQQMLIQGWALIDNVSEQDLENVELSLVSGLPISFRHDLYTARYQPRPEIKVKKETAYAPPVMEEAVRVKAKKMGAPANRMDPEMAACSFGGPMPAPRPMMMMARAGGMAMADEESRELTTEEAMEASNVVAASGGEIGDLFEYKIDVPVSIKRNDSALVPILFSSCEGGKVSIYNEATREKNPMAALRLFNTSGFTLEGGPVTVFESIDGKNAYMGEAMLKSCKAAEEQLLPYSVDLDCIISSSLASSEGPEFAARVLFGTVEIMSYYFTEKYYAITNKKDSEMDLYLEHKFAMGFDFDSAVFGDAIDQHSEKMENGAPVEILSKTENFYRFRLKVPAKSNRVLLVKERRQNSSSFYFNAWRLTPKVQLWISKGYFDEDTTKKMHQIMSKGEEIERLRSDVCQLEVDINTLNDKQERIRKNMEPLNAASTEERKLREKYVSQMEKNEDLISEKQAALESLRKTIDQKERELQEIVQNVRFDKK